MWIIRLFLLIISESNIENLRIKEISGIEYVYKRFFKVYNNPNNITI